MGVGFEVSAFHSVIHMEPDADAPSSPQAPPGWLSLMPNARWDPRPRKNVTSPTDDIIRWRAHLAAKYHPQLGEPLAWDETSEFTADEDLATSWPYMLHYVAITLDLAGMDAARALKGVMDEEVDRKQAHGLFAQVEARGFTGRFPQLLLGPFAWLPFRRNMIIEEPDWRGDVTRFGSLPNLLAELTILMRFIVGTDPAAPNWQELGGSDPSVLAAAWKAAASIDRLGRIARQRNLPLWTTD